MAKNKTKNKNNNYLQKKQTILLACFFFLLTALSILNLSIYLNTKPSEVWINDSNVDQQIYLWKSFMNVHPNYFQGWVELANLEISKGDHKEAQFAFLNAWKINPNSEEIALLETKLKEF